MRCWDGGKITIEQPVEIKAGIVTQHKGLRLKGVEGTPLPVAHVSPGALHEQRGGRHIPAFEAIAYPPVEVAVGSTSGHQAHVECHRATNTEHLLHTTLPLDCIEMLPQGIAR